MECGDEMPDRYCDSICKSHLGSATSETSEVILDAQPTDCGLVRAAHGLAAALRAALPEPHTTVPVLHSSSNLDSLLTEEAAAAKATENATEKATASSVSCAPRVKRVKNKQS